MKTSEATMMRLALRLALRLVLPLLAGCAAPAPTPVVQHAPFTVDDYASRAPVEVAVVGPSGAPNFTVRDGETLREHVYSLLLKKGYTPLSPAFVDRAIASVPHAGSGTPSIASLRSALRTDAFLFLDVVQVKTVPGGDPPIYRIEARATLLDGVAGTTLFDHRAPMTFEVDYGENRELRPEQLDDILGRYAGRLMTPLPGRRSPESP